MTEPTDDDSEHFMECGICGAMFDMRDMDQVMAHEHDGPKLATGIRGESAADGRPRGPEMATSTQDYTRRHTWALRCVRHLSNADHLDAAAVNSVCVDFAIGAMEVEAECWQGERESLTAGRDEARALAEAWWEPGGAVLPWKRDPPPTHVHVHRWNTPGGEVAEVAEVLPGPGPNAEPEGARHDPSNPNCPRSIAGLERESVPCICKGSP
jgi:hypothetical protein